MKLISKQESVERKNSDICIVTEYPKIDEQMDFAIVTINGQYPAEKSAVNLVCKEIVYVAEGGGKVKVNGKNYRIKSGDIILIEAGEKFVWHGQMTLHISCRPAFTIAQHQIAD